MLEFICYFMPAFISINIHRYLTKDTKLENTIIYYGIYVAINNFLTIVIKNIKHLRDVINFDVVNVTYLYKYLAVAIVISIITPYIINIIIQNINIRVKVNKNEKKQSKKNN